MLAMDDRPPGEAYEPQGTSHGELMDIARLAYIYGLPAYEVARLRYRALGRPRNPLQINTFRHTRTVNTPGNTDVTAVNSDTLLSRAWLDLSREPLVIHLPEETDRYYSLALMDIFTNNFAVLGPRTTSAVAGDVLLTGPRWDGAVSGETTVIRAPTNAVWALVRILVDETADLRPVHSLQDQLGIRPSGLGPASPSADHASRIPRVAPLDDAKPLVFFDVLNAVLTENPTSPEDQPILDRLRRVGVGPALEFRRADFSPPQLAALRRGIAAGQQTIRTQVGFRTGEPPPGRSELWPSDELLRRLRGPTDTLRVQMHADRRLGWSGPVGAVGNFGTDYLLRAQCALAGIGLLPRAEAMYFTTASDAQGVPLDGRHRHVLRFPGGRLPPVDAFWSLTVYRTDENNRRWLVPNEIDRYSLGSYSHGLRHGKDGGVEVFIQQTSPEGDSRNWLPAPEGRFVVTLRAYRPRRELLEGHYAIPDVERYQ
jgi:hypothetical protein